MTDRTADVLRTFPPRTPNPDERTPVNEWLAAKCNMASAYVSERRGDDPAISRRVVISVGSQRTSSYLIHAPAGMNCWLVSSVARRSDIRRYDSLKSALNSIWEVFVD